MADGGEGVAEVGGGDGEIPVIEVEHDPIALLEHVNLNAGLEWEDESRIATWFFHVLGAVRDPRADAISEKRKKGGAKFRRLVWANLGWQQFHLPTGHPEMPTQKLRGVLVLGYCGEEAEKMVLRAKEAEFEVREGSGEGVEVVGPMGNVYRVVQVEQDVYFGPISPAPRDALPPLPGGRSVGLGIVGMEHRCPKGTAVKIGEWYRTVFGCKTVECGEASREVVVKVGFQQFLKFVEVGDGEEVGEYDGHHIAIYTNNFAQAYRNAAALHLVYNNPRFPDLTYDSIEDALRHNEFRTLHITSPTPPHRHLLTLEHEIRSLAHKGFASVLAAIQDTAGHS